jgi:hypothetical protein
MDMGEFYGYMGNYIWGLRLGQAGFDFMLMGMCRVGG